MPFFNFFLTSYLYIAFFIGPSVIKVVETFILANETPQRPQKDNKNIIIFGAGYVGTITGVCLAKCNHHVTLIDPNVDKVNALNAKKSLIQEPQIVELIQETIENGSLRAKPYIENDLLEADIVMIAVATPTTSEGTLQLHSLKSILALIQESAKKRTRPLILSIRSTILPTILRQLTSEYLSESLSTISLVVNPEFLRESTAVYDFFHAPFCIAGSDDLSAANMVLDLYKDICPKRVAVSLETACLLKYCCNAFHAAKICFANEIASICESIEANPVEIMDLFCQDQLLNCSSAYLKPGFSFGGSCLPKDLQTLVTFGKSQNIVLPLLSSILPSNQNRFQNTLQHILQAKHQKLAIIGMSFKKHCDDLRNSPFLKLIEELNQNGINLSIYDPDVQADLIRQSNPEIYKLHLAPLIPLLRDNLKFALEGCDGVVLCKDMLPKSLADKLIQDQIPIYDLHYYLQKSP